MIRYYAITFITTTGKKIKLRITKGKEMISTVVAKAALAKILDANILLLDSGDLQSVDSLRYVEIDRIPFQVL